MFRVRSHWVAILAVTAMALCLTTAQAQPIVDEDFNNVTGTGGGPLLFGSGFSLIHDWDTGITGESAFAGTTERARINASVEGDPTGGPDGSGAGKISVSNITFNPVHRDFANVWGYPGATFADSNGIGEGFTTNWDDGIDGESAFGAVTGGAVLNGRMRAEGLLATQQAHIFVRDVDVTSGTWTAGLIFDAPPFEGATVLLNPGFETGTFDGWTTFGANNYVASEFVRSGSFSFKKFGEFSGSYSASGIYQELPAQEGQTWQLDAWSAHIAGDSLTGTQNQMVMNIEYYNSNGTMINTDGPVTILDTSSPTDTWIDNTVAITAPAGTVTARAVLMFIQPANEGGAAHIDDVTFEVISGPPQNNVDLAAINLTADIMGVANAGAGETIGDYQLRIEDPEGNRLIYSGTAPSGAMTTVGGPLSTFVEATSNGVTSNGVFDVGAANYRVVIAFDNEPAVTWGTGGELVVDNVILTGSDPGGSAWYAGVFWDGLGLGSTDLSQLVLTADIAGDATGGDYELRLEGIQVNSSGVNEAFIDITTTGGDALVTYDMYTSGVSSNYTTDWDTGILGEIGWGGIGVGTTLCDSATECPGLEDVGITVRAIDTDGHGDSTSGQIKVAGLYSVPPGVDWYAGVGWPNQGLASTDLSQVTLSAWVKGVADVMWGQSLGSIELRIEDAQGDRMYKQVTANGAWQFIGGTLDTFTEGGAAGGGGDGTFDLDSDTYTVVIAFDQPFATWGYGGAIRVDDVHITPFAVTREVGTVSFTGTVDAAKSGTFQTIGGLLSGGVSTFVEDLSEMFDSVAGDLVQFWPGYWWYENWESGIDGEAAFAGTWGTGSLTSVSAEGCVDCGTNGTGGARLVFSGNNGGTSGGWWAGLVFPGLRADLSTADLSNVYFTAKIKGEVNGAGSTLGNYTLRLEDPQTDFLAFDVTATGDWQAVGGPLSTATAGSTPDGDGSFDYLAGSYNATLVMENGTGYNTWGTGGKLTIDKIFLSLPGNGIADCDTFTVTMAYDNEVSTWPDGGTLTIDNLLFTRAGSPDCDVDTDVDLADFAYFQQCFTGEGGGVPSGCECADLNFDGNVDIDDYRLINLRMEGPQ